MIVLRIKTYRPIFCSTSFPVRFHDFRSLARWLVQPGNYTRIDRILSITEIP